jgi:hypothetical protein
MKRWQLQRHRYRTTPTYSRGYDKKQYLIVDISMNTPKRVLVRALCICCSSSATHLDRQLGDVGPPAAATLYLASSMFPGMPLREVRKEETSVLTAVFPHPLRLYHLLLFRDIHANMHAVGRSGTVADMSFRRRSAVTSYSRACASNKKRITEIRDEWENGWWPCLEYTRFSCVFLVVGLWRPGVRVHHNAGSQVDTPIHA